jgi:hypothetical protein
VRVIEHGANGCDDHSISCSIAAAWKKSQCQLSDAKWNYLIELKLANLVDKFSKIPSFPAVFSVTDSCVSKRFGI